MLLKCHLSQFCPICWYVSDISVFKEEKKREKNTTELKDRHKLCYQCNSICWSKMMTKNNMTIKTFLTVDYKLLQVMYPDRWYRRQFYNISIRLFFILEKFFFCQDNFITFQIDFVILEEFFFLPELIIFCLSLTNQISSNRVYGLNLPL